jgi:hypothetical protein
MRFSMTISAADSGAFLDIEPFYTKIWKIKNADSPHLGNCAFQGK